MTSNRSPEPASCHSNYDQTRLSFGGGYVQPFGSGKLGIDYAASTIDPFGLVQAFALTVSF